MKKNSKLKIGILDYGAGNIRSVENALARIGVEHFFVSNDPKKLETAGKIIFPGVGRAATAMRNLRAKNLDKFLHETEKPVLGICLGMQLLFDFSDEDSTECLKIIPGKIKKFDERSITKIPHIGRNFVPEFDEYFYFVHSFFAPISKFTISETEYSGQKFSAAVKFKNFFATQFHPEKSGAVGEKILREFCAEKSKKEIWLAIDLLDGECVRLTEGAFGSEKVYSKNPLEIAEKFEKFGFKNLHIVDLDGAKSGENPNFKIVQKICSITDLKVQIGGGIRDLKTAQKYFDAGVFRIIVGSAAIEDPEFLRECLSKFGAEKIVLGVDVRQNSDQNFEIFIHGWEKNSGILADDFLSQKFPELKNILMTDISKDGKLTGPNFKMYEKFMKKFPEKNFIASGGISKMSDILNLKNREIIVGKAIYENKISLEKLAKT